MELQTKWNTRGICFTSYNLMTNCFLLVILKIFHANARLPTVIILLSIKKSKFSSRKGEKVIKVASRCQIFNLKWLIAEASAEDYKLIPNSVGEVTTYILGYFRLYTLGVIAIAI